MKSKLSNVLIRIYGVIFGVGGGLLLGIFIVATLIRVLIYTLLGFGDSGPQWVNWAINGSIVITVAICTWLGLKWAQSVLESRRET